ncbi:response regulator [Sinomonas atrocyanea]|uniref:response regulator n=1 Tax=Sinomonas atrocyanea TaxID=37927 RepID=UPI002789D6B6|nr:response regulator [Sinomonas atrocyanea]MDQ0261693.1 response regulator of citrate/malate metabolism [Sinomonas atrocyanea]MDR6620122.1 response regulator of citrate/malate metabolism [Sinomonas atrocyanea]
MSAARPRGGAAPGIRVLVVEDEPIAAAAHAAYLGRVPGFVHAGTAHDGASALRLAGELAAAGEPVDLVLLDMNLPDLHGLDVGRRMRAAGHPVDIIAITAVRELPVVRRAISVGVVQYLIKPFTFAAFAERLEHYRAYREALADGAGPASQAAVDEALAVLRAPVATPLPKGLSAGTLEAIRDVLRAKGAPVSASEVTEAVGVSRVTARRYLEHLAETKEVTRSARYGAPGRPENEYRWIG